MVGNEQEERLDFNALVARCAVSDKKKEQEEYLVKVIMKLLTERYGRGAYFPDSNVFQGHRSLTNEEVDLAMKMLDVVYASASKALLGDLCHDMLGVRSEAIKYMQSELKLRQEIPCEAGI